jgi:hypothetical protein
VGKGKEQDTKEKKTVEVASLGGSSTFSWLAFPSSFLSSLTNHSIHGQFSHAPANRLTQPRGDGGTLNSFCRPAARESGHDSEQRE